MKRLIPIVLSIALVACGGDSATTTQAPTTQPGGDAATATTTTKAPTTTTTTEAPTTTTTAPPEPSASECLVGSWNLDSENFVDALMQAMGSSGLPGELEPTDGTYVIEMDDDGTFTSTRDGWGYRIVSQEGTIVVQIDGTETGTYTVDGDTVTVAMTGGDATVSMGMEVGGEIQDLPFPMEMNLPSNTVEGTGQFECTDETLTVTTTAEGPDGGELSFMSVFTRA